MTQNNLQYLKAKLKQKGFRIELPNDYAFPGSYPGAKDFSPPPNKVVLDTLVQYSEETHAKIEFVSTDSPIIFYLVQEKHGKILRELYQAKVCKGCRHPLDLCYYISCTQL